MPDRCRLLAAALLLAVAGAVAGAPALAHHGWAWATDDNFTLTGTVVEARLGNPHGVVTVETAEGETWRIEVGQPWRNAAAGLEDAMLAPGVTITAVGHRSADPDERLMKAERVNIDGLSYILYPDRD